MSPRSRYFVLAGVRIVGALGAVGGVILIARAHAVLPRVIGTALVLSAIYMAATVSAALAHRWRSGVE